MEVVAAVNIFKLQFGKISSLKPNPTEGQYPKYIKNSRNQSPKQQTALLKMGDRNKMTQLRNLEWLTKHLKKGAKALLIREMQIKTTLRFHLRPKQE